MMQAAQQYWSRRRGHSDFYDLAIIVLIVGLIVIAVLIFHDYGISNDEEVQHRYGELIIAYYRSGFADPALFNFKNLYLYGGLFDVIAALIARLVPYDLYLVRHLLSGLIGVGGIAATAATARLIAGPRAGFLAAIMLAACGAWFGAMFNHTKDIPFAAAMMASIYFLLRAARDLPHPRWRDTLGFGIFAGAALGLRALGLFVIGYAFLAIAFRVPWREGIRNCTLFLARSAARFIPAFAVSYLIMIAAWPWSSLSFFNPLRAIFAFTHFHYVIHTIIAGHIFAMADVPWWYVPSYLLIKLPIILLIGAISAMVLAARPVRAATDGRNPSWRWEIAFVAFIALFPLLCEMATEGPAFDGLRHFLFLVPPLAVLGGLGLDALLALSLPRLLWIRRAGIAIVTLALMWDASVLVRLHPYENLFYNASVGGVQGASRRYVMDYWANIMPEAVHALEAHLDRTESKAVPPFPYTVGVCGEQFSFEDYADKRLKWTGGWQEADFFIAPTHMSCDQVLDGKIVATIERLGVPIGVVKDRRAITRPGLARHQ